VASSVEQLAARLGQVLDQIGVAQRVVVRALALVGQAAGGYAQVRYGSAAQDPKDAAARMASAQRALTEVQASLAAVDQHLVRYLALLGITTTAGAPPSSAGTGPPSASIDKLRGLLPPPVVSGSGQKTHGRWVGPDGTDHPVVSGRDADSTAAWEMLKRRGITAWAEPIAVSHVEQKLAARMVREKITHATLVINNTPCGGVLGCDALLPVLLPAGYSLTVHGPNYRKTFTGGAVPRWR
jgi:hypothetical protein